MLLQGQQEFLPLWKVVLANKVKRRLVEKVQSRWS